MRVQEIDWCASLSNESLRDEERGVEKTVEELAALAGRCRPRGGGSRGRGRDYPYAVLPWTWWTGIVCKPADTGNIADVRRRGQ
jgi:hypothetical protein